MQTKHVSVLLNESIELLNINSSGTYVDCTYGNGGHSRQILSKLSDKGKLIALDRDSSVNKNLISKEKNFTLVNEKFSNLGIVLENLNVKGVDGFLYDIGVSSMQFDEESRGFSYRFNSQLDMRMDTTQEFDAKKLINDWEIGKLTKIFKELGESNFASSVARSIVKSRPINTTFELVEAIKKGLPSRELRKKGHPAKVYFQAIRMTVNQEIEELQNSLKEAIKHLNIGGRIVVITFHSIEDRVVKQFFKSLNETNIPKEIPILAKDVIVNYEIITKKPITPSMKELEENSRSRSSKMRCIERIR
jgi:16S rRNA (cytosine1402-N4)-methyltransferase